MKKWCLLLVAAVLPFLALAQKKTTTSAAVWPELQLNYGVGESGILFLQNQYRINTDGGFNDLAEQGPLSSFQRVQLALGYEHTFTDHWRGGALGRFAFENFPKQQFYTLFLRHNGNIRSLYFNKQAMFEYVTMEQQDASGRFRLMAELGRRTALKNSYLTPAISYEVFFYNEFGQQSAVTNDRIFDRTRLRIGLTYELTESFRITPYFMRQTEYYNVLAKYDENSVLVEDAHKANRIYPVVGLELKYNFRSPVNTASITY